MPSSEDSAKPVVIHVPKTGGTTLIMAITRGRMQPKADEHYRHVLWNEDRTITHSNCGDLFEPDGAERYAGRKVMLTLRTPTTAVASVVTTAAQMAARGSGGSDSGVQVPPKT